MYINVPDNVGDIIHGRRAASENDAKTVRRITILKQCKRDSEAPQNGTEIAEI